LRGWFGRTVLHVRAARPFSFPLSVLPVWIAAAVAPRAVRWHVPSLVACTWAVLLLHAAGNLLNDYFDWHSGVDRADGDMPGRPGRVLTRGLLAPADALGSARACVAAGIGPAAYLAVRAGPLVVPFVALGVLGLYAYTGPPIHLKYRALGEPLVFVVFGPLLMGGAVLACGGALTPAPLLLSVPVGMVTTAVLAGNNLRDRCEDLAGGVKTLAHVIGPRWQRRLFVALVLGAPVLAALLGTVCLRRPATAAVVLTALAARGPIRAAYSSPVAPDVDARTARYGALVMLALLCALVLG
jgi:1,4-dihydroxy-2-naphthoate octaprenyltransferase